jgi:hypothetical protein
MSELDPYLGQMADRHAKYLEADRTKDRPAILILRDKAAGVRECGP